MLAEDHSPLTSDTFPHNISSSSTSTQRADVLEEEMLLPVDKYLPILNLILGSSKSSPCLNTCSCSHVLGWVLYMCHGNETHHIVTGCKDITVEESALPLGIWLSAQVPFTWPYKYVVTFTLDQTRTGRQKVIERLNTLKYPHGLKGRDPHITKREWQRAKWDWNCEKVI